MSGAGGGGGSGGNDPMAWLGLLKWTLNYVDGTKSHDEKSLEEMKMSDEDKKFLETVMAEGIIDENERMKFILQQLTAAVEYYMKKPTKDDDATTTSSPSPSPPIDEDELIDLLQELRDIVEQIDYARAFLSLKGLPFLLGCIQQQEQTKEENEKRGTVPIGVRLACLGIISTLAQNNPPVQKECLELGAVKILSDLFFQNNNNNNDNNTGTATNDDDEDDDASNVGNVKKIKLQATIMQCISSVVRHYDLAEVIFCQLPQAPTLMTIGLAKKLSKGNNDEQQPTQVQQVQKKLNTKTLFFLRALLTSDVHVGGNGNDGSNDKNKQQQQQQQQQSPATLLDRGTIFVDALRMVIQEYLIETTYWELREMAIAMIEQLLETSTTTTTTTTSSSSTNNNDDGVIHDVTKVSCQRILYEQKQFLITLGIQRISTIRKLPDGSDEKELLSIELEHWERVMTLLAQLSSAPSSTPTDGRTTNADPSNQQPPLLLKM